KQENSLRTSFNFCDKIPCNTQNPACKLPPVGLQCLLEHRRSSICHLHCVFFHKRDDRRREKKSRSQRTTEIGWDGNEQHSEDRQPWCGLQRHHDSLAPAEGVEL